MGAWILGRNVYETVRANALRMLKLAAQGWAGGPLPEIDDVLERAKVVPLGTGEVLFHIGEAHPYTYYNLSGALRLQTIVDDRLITTGIRLDGELVADVSGLGLPFVRTAISMDAFPQARDLRTIGEGVTRHVCTALETSLLMRFDAAHIGELTDRHREWGRLFTSFLIMHQTSAEMDFAITRAGSPTERYRTLTARRPDLVRRITQREIAGLLGISEAGLSRIVKRANVLADN